MSCGDPGQIVSVIPCNDAKWRAVFRDDGRAGFVVELVACWFLVAHGHDERHVHPGVAMGAVIDDATHADTYLFVVDPYVSDTDIKKMIADFDAGDEKTDK